MTLTVLKRTGQVYGRKPLYGNWMFSLLLDYSQGSGEEDHGGAVPPSSHFVKVHSLL
jgi:hypothetical protein